MTSDSPRLAPSPFLHPSKLSPTPSTSTLTSTTTSITDKPLPQIPAPTAVHNRWLVNLRRPRAVQKGQQNQTPSTASSLIPRSDPRIDSALTSAQALNSSDVPAASREAEETMPEEIESRETRTPVYPKSQRLPDGARTENSRDKYVTLPISTVNHGRTKSFTGLTTDIPTGSFDEISSPDNIKFSARGSMLLDGKRLAAIANGTKVAADMRKEREIATRREQPMRNRSAMSMRPPSRALSIDEVTMSQKVRSMYEQGGEKAPEWTEQPPIVEDEETPHGSSSSIPASRQSHAQESQRGRLSRLASYHEREPFEIAGGIEDWEDVRGGQVDRYGFIMANDPEPSSSDKVATPYGSPAGIHRVSSALHEMSRSPRTKRSIRRRLSAAAKSERSIFSSGGNRQSGIGELGRVATQSNGSIATTHYTNRSAFSSAPSPLRRATNRLPHNRRRRLLDEASDMLTLPPGLAEIAEQEDAGKTAMAMKKKEWKREDKWRKMGKAIQPSPTVSTMTENPQQTTRRGSQGKIARARQSKGGGMLFEFDPRDPKVASRTWKGVPDRWRASAWYSFLAHSHRTHKIGLPDDDLIDFFFAAQDEPCADDVQIDCDVPRTINRHIMFRRRYRGGQRLLFRVLHAVALFFADLGYVQGMAALAATFLCYFDEERAFVMMVRLWQLRGLEKLFAAGFGGLMEALDDFESNWLASGDVGKKLVELGIPPTAYGTRWYLTLFNYSIPFPAQLRVWDVFLLLGDAVHPQTQGYHQSAPSPNAATAAQSRELSHNVTTNEGNSVPSTASTSAKRDPFYPATLAPLHATAAALIDATREILLDSDFENVMKVLTSWIPIKDEDLLMRVVAAEFKSHQRK